MGEYCLSICGLGRRVHNKTQYESETDESLARQFVNPPVSFSTDLVEGVKGWAEVVLCMSSGSNLSRASRTSTSSHGERRPRRSTRRKRLYQ